LNDEGEAMRIIAADVAYKKCATTDCDTLYEGTRCPRCKEGFDPAVVYVTDKERLVVVDVDPPVYEPTQRCRCPQCKNLFALTEGDVVAHGQCRYCKKSLLSREDLRKLWKKDDSLVLRARHLDNACRKLEHCPQCDTPLSVKCWCPLWRKHENHRDESCLPTRTGEIWVRTFNVIESLDEVQERERQADAESEDETEGMEPFHRQMMNNEENDYATNSDN
jgi:hypothetical protein